MSASQSETKLTNIHIDMGLQPRVGGLDEDHVRQLQDISENWPPLVVVEQNGKYLLVDGFHRYAAAQNLRLATVAVKVMDVPEDNDLFSLAFSLNAIHGRPLSLSDRRAYAERLLIQHSDWADREIGRHCGLSQPTVAVVRSRLEATAKIEQTGERVGAGGYTYKVGTNTKQRQPGELPEHNPLDAAACATSSQVTPAQRTQQRRITQYLQRLGVALEDGNDLDGWETAEDAANACVAVLGQDRAKALAERIGCNCQDVLDVAALLGYREDAR